MKGNTNDAASSALTVWVIVLAALPVVALFLYLQKYIVGGLTAGSEK